MFVIPDARSAIRKPGASSYAFAPGFRVLSFAEPRNDDFGHASSLDASRVKHPKSREQGAWGRAGVVPRVRCLRTAACRHAPFAIVMRQAVTRRFFTPLERSPSGVRGVASLRCAPSVRARKALSLRLPSAFPPDQVRGSVDITLNRIPHARLARLAGEPPVRGMGA